MRVTSRNYTLTSLTQFLVNMTFSKNKSSFNQGVGLFTFWTNSRGFQNVRRQCCSCEGHRAALDANQPASIHLQIKRVNLSRVILDCNTFDPFWLSMWNDLPSKPGGWAECPFTGGLQGDSWFHPSPNGWLLWFTWYSGYTGFKYSDC